MAGPDLHRMAWRNLWRNTRRTLITLSSFAFGVLLAIVFTGMGDSSYGKMIDLAARTGAGHVSLEHPDYLEAPSLGKTVEHASELREIALRQRHVVRAVPRISGATMLATARNSYGAYFIAVDPALEDSDTLSIVDSITKGKWFQTPDDKGIIIGATLADNLGVQMGEKVVYTMTDKHGEIVSGLARVSGIVHTGAPTVDGSMCVLPIGVVRRILGYGPDEAVQVAVFVDDQRRSAEVAAALQKELGPQVAALTWKQTQPDLAAFIEMDGAGSIVFETIIMILVAAGIFNSLFVSVMERQREFGILMAIGFGPGQISRLVVWESLWLALVGLVAAAVVTVGPYWYLHVHGIDYSSMMGSNTEISGVVLDPILYTDIQPHKILIIAGLVVVTTLLAGLYPAWRASRVVPVDAIKLV